MIRHDTIRYDMIRYGTIRYDTIRYDTIRYDTRRGTCDTCCGVIEERAEGHVTHVVGSWTSAPEEHQHASRCCLLLLVASSCFLLLLDASCCVLLLLVASCCFLLLFVASCCLLLLLVAFATVANSLGDRPAGHVTHVVGSLGSAPGDM